jgi:hypothetical protein
MGVINVSTDVQDAEVFVDGAFVGNAPATLELTEGIHIIEVKKEGHSSYKRETRVIGNSETSLRAKLKQ